MIPLENKEQLIKKLEEGYELKDAQVLAKIPKTSLYRLFREQPGFRVDVDEAIKKGTNKLEVKVKDIEKLNLEEIRKIINRRKK